MKLNLKVFKKGKPIYWVIGAVILFVFFYWIVSRSGGSASTSSGGMTVVQSGPSDAAVAANAQLALAGQQTSAAVAIAQGEQSAAVAIAQGQHAADIAVANLAAQVQLAGITADTEAAMYAAALQAQNQSEYLTAQQNIVAQQVGAAITQAQIQSNYGIATATIAAQSVYDQAAFQTQMFNKQLDTNAAMFSKQIEAANFQMLTAQIPNLIDVDRDNMLALLIAQNSGTALDFQDAGFNRGIGSSYSYRPGQPLLAN